MPLSGVRVVELAGIGPGPHAAMMLSDLGADVVRVVRADNPDREGAGGNDRHTLRGRTVVAADLKDPGQLAAIQELIDDADVLIEGFRPGVTERLGIGPGTCVARNPGLVYARMTGWGQTGPWAARAGHDINYISITGALHAVGPADTPVPPLNLVGDFGGGSMFLVTGILAALYERDRRTGAGSTGTGQVLDVAMLDGASTLMQQALELRRIGLFTDERGHNLLDGGAPFYSTYACADGRHVAVGALEPQFYAALLTGLGLDADALPDRDDEGQWPALRECFATAFATRTRDEWSERFAGIDACVTPVLTWAEAPGHPQVAARRSLIRDGRDVIAAAAPRFSRTPTEPYPGPASFARIEDVLERWSGPRVSTENS